MQNEEVVFREDIYKEHLTTINGIKFTPRQIDVISCLVCMKGTKKIAELLSSPPKSVSPDTVRTHIQSIMQRVGCSSRDGIIDFVEKHRKLYILRDYYSSLVIEVAFEKSLNEISKLKREESPRSFIIYCQNQTLKKHLFSRLIIHLNQADIKAEIIEYARDQKIETTENGAHIRLLLLNKEESNEVLQKPIGTSSIDLSKFQNYYFAVFEVLKKLLPKADLNYIFINFETQYKGLYDPLAGNRYQILPTNINLNYDVDQIIYKFISFFKDRKCYVTSCFLLISFSSIGLLIFKEGTKSTQNATKIQSLLQEKKEAFSIRSDLIIPSESSLLHRPELIARLDEKLKGENDIKTVALVGPGGAGKTTLARQYAHQQEYNVIWECNAEKQDALKLSFENLAYALAKTKEDKSILRSIQDIRDSIEREEKIIQFVKDHLRFQGNWLLIFDNVERFTDIQKFFPHDTTTWGDGKIILTTRDSNIENNNHINHVIIVGELSSDQKVNLFTKIIYRNNISRVSSEQNKKIKIFIEKLPSFPLDISVAAYYLKATNIPYPKYLEKVSMCNKDFEEIQCNILKESGNYHKTRYDIIISSLREIISIHPDFQDLLLFISLLDSQNIQRSLLNKYKNSNVVDNFIYNLKKYSLIINDSSILSDRDMSISIHRNTHAIILAFFLKTLGSRKINKFIYTNFNILEDYAEEKIKEENFLHLKLFANHLNTIFVHSKLLGEEIKGIIGNKLGCILYYLLDYANAEKILKESLVYLNKSSHKNSIRVAQNLSYLGIVYRERGNYEKAKQLLEQSVKIFRNYIPKDPIGIARALEFLGFTYRILGNLKKSKKLLEESLEIYSKNPNNIGSIVDILAQLGITCKELGEFKKAKTLLEESCSLYKKHSNENCLNLIRFGNAYVSLGRVYISCCDYEKAKNVLEQALLVHKKYLPINHTDIAWILVNLGIAYTELGDYENAKIALERSLTIYKESYGENNLETSWVIFALGNLHAKIGHYNVAKDMLDQHFIMCKLHYGKAHNHTATTLRKIGDIYLLKGDLMTAEKFITKAIDIYKKNNHPVYKCLESLGDIYIKKSYREMNNGNVKYFQQLKKQAIEVLKQALRKLETEYPEDTPEIKKIQTKITQLNR